MGGSNFQLSQDGDRVWGRFSYGNGDGFARGSWSEGRLILILTPTAAQVGGACDPRKIVVITPQGTATALQPYVLDLSNNANFSGRMTRTSPNPGAAVEYPYEAELKNCGQLFTYELSFDTNSDKLKGTDWAILETLVGRSRRTPRSKSRSRGTPMQPAMPRLIRISRRVARKR